MKLSHSRIKELKLLDKERFKKITQIKKELQLAETELSLTHYWELRTRLNDDYLFFSAYEFFMNAQKREQTGAVYTPEWIVRYMCEHVLDKWQSANPDKSLWDASILDISCGTGNFVHVLFEELLSRLKQIQTDVTEKEIAQHISLNIIHAWDINADALNICASRLEILSGFAPANIKENNTLLQVVDNAQQFDMIIGNPPYGDLLDDATKKQLGDTYNNIALNFIDWALKATKKTGEIALIVPHSFTRVKNRYDVWRKKIYEGRYLHAIVDVGNPFWDITLEEVIFFFNHQDNQMINTYSFKDEHYHYPVKLEEFYNQKFHYKMMLYWDDFYHAMQQEAQKNNYYPFSGKRGQDILKKDLLTEPQADALWFILGKNIDKFQLKHVNNYDRYVLPEQTKSNLKITTPILAITQFGTNLKACLLDSQCYPSGGVVLVNHQGLSQQEAMHYLNCPSINHYLKKYVFNNADLTVHIDGIYLTEIPYIELDKLKEIEKLLTFN
jgi:type I restriction-modification system DNA methylase subunit